MRNQSLNHCLDDARYRFTREVRENPLMWIGLAVGAGVVIGALVGRSALTADKSWLSGLASDFNDQAHKAGERTRRAGRLVNRELHSAAERAADSLPGVELDRLVRRGRRWLRAKLA